MGFLLTVSNRQQWQKGDSLLNFKFGERVAPGLSHGGGWPAGPGLL